MIIGMLGFPLAGKTTISHLIEKIFSGESKQLYSSVKKEVEGFVKIFNKTYEMNCYHLVTKFEFANTTFYLECISGAAPIEASIIIAKRTDIFVYVFDIIRPYKMQLDYWQSLKPYINREKLFCIINKKDLAFTNPLGELTQDEIKNSYLFLSKYNITDNCPCLLISAIDPDSKSYLKEFFEEFVLKNT